MAGRTLLALGSGQRDGLFAFHEQRASFKKACLHNVKPAVAESETCVRQLSGDDMTACSRRTCALVAVASWHAPVPSAESCRAVWLTCLVRRGGSVLTPTLCVAVFSHVGATDCGQEAKSM